jgi:fructokinase
MTSVRPVKTDSVIGAIEAGGTKIVCAVGRTWQEVRDGEKFVVPTTTPDETLSQIIGWFAERNREAPLEAMGIASFGPIDFESNRISMSTPKVAWRGVSWKQVVEDNFGGIPIGYDTDTNGAGVAEWRWGAAQGRGVAVYVTVGTGIGGGLIIDGVPVHGLLHPEFGHMTVQRPVPWELSEPRGLPGGTGRRRGDQGTLESIGSAVRARPSRVGTRE